MMQSQHEPRVLLPWYVNGTLHGAARQELENQLERSPTLRSELVWLRLLRGQIREHGQAQRSQRSDSAGLDTLMALVHGEQAGKVLPLRKRLTGWLSAARSLPLSAGIAAAVVLSQAVIIAALLDQPTPEPLTPLSGGTIASGPLLQITFKSVATEAQIRAVLASVQGDIVAGPGALGVYTVRVPDRQGALALERLRNDAWVIDSVVLLPSR